MQFWIDRLQAVKDERRPTLFFSIVEIPECEVVGLILVIITYFFLKKEFAKFFLLNNAKSNKKI
jgi:hypothetical protein